MAFTLVRDILRSKDLGKDLYRFSFIKNQKDMRQGGTMEVRKTLQAGERGTKRWQNQFGDKLLIVRYRYDDIKELRFTTVELVVEEKPYVHCDINGSIKPAITPPLTDNINEDVYLKIDYHELKQRQQVKAAGAYWEPEKRLWKLNIAKVKELGLEDRITKCS